MDHREEERRPRRGRGSYWGYRGRGRGRGRGDRGKSGGGKPLCVYYSEHGRCRYGSRCRFVHQHKALDIKSRDSELESDPPTSLPSIETLDISPSHGNMPHHHEEEEAGWRSVPVSAFHTAAFFGNASDLEKLLPKVPSVDCPFRGVTPLFVASSQGHVKAVRFLLDNCALPAFEQDGTGDTAIICAARRGHKLIVQILIEAGAFASVPNADGRSAMDYLRRSSHYDHRDPASLLVDSALKRRRMYLQELFGYIQERFGGSETIVHSMLHFLGFDTIEFDRRASRAQYSAKLLPLR